MREPKPFFRTQTKCWYVQFDKRQINLGPDEKAAWDKYHALMDERRRGIVKADDSVANVLNRHLAWVRDNRAEATFKKKLAHLRSFGQYIGPKLKVSELKPYHVQRWVDREYKDGSDTYRHIAISEVQAALNWASGLGYIQDNPVAKMTNKPQAGIREFILPSKRWPELLEAIRDRQFRDYVTVMLTTGARAQEMPKIEARHFEPENRRIFFPKSEAKGKKRPRVIYLPDEALAIVERWAKRYPSGPIFRNTQGRPWCKDAVNDRFKRLKKKLKCPKLCATTLRHSYAHHLLTSGVDSHIVSKLMGHVDERMLIERYGHVEQNPEFMSGQANRIGSPLVPANVVQLDIALDSGQSLSV